MSPLWLQWLSQRLWRIIGLHLPALFTRPYNTYMLTLIYRALNGNTPVYIKNLLIERDTSYNLSGQHLLNVPRVNTTNYGLHSVRYSACKLWNSLPNSFRTAPTTNAFKVAVDQIKFNSHHRRTGSFGLWGAVTLLPEKNCAMPESMCCTNALKSQ